MPSAYRRLSPNGWDLPLQEMSAEDYHNDLQDKPCSSADFAKIRSMQATLNLQTFGDEHDCYLASDVLALADIMESVRATLHRQFDLDLARSLTMPSVAYKSLCRVWAGVVQLVTEQRNGGQEFVDLVNRNMFGGICVPFQPIAEANEPGLGRDSPNKPARSIAQFDITSLYPWAMSRSIPVGDIRIEDGWTQESALQLIRDWSFEQDVGYGMVVDLRVPKQLHDWLDFAPFARLDIRIEALGKEQQEAHKALKSATGKRLAPYLGDQHGIFHHVCLLQVYLEMGVELVVRQVWRFKQACVFTEWIQQRHDKRMEATTEMEKQVEKLTMVSVYGKTVENKGSRRNETHYVDVEKWYNAASRPGNNPSVVCLEPFIGMAQQLKHKPTVLDTPRYIGWAILSISKARMYAAHYLRVRRFYADCSTWTQTR